MVGLLGLICLHAPDGVVSAGIGGHQNMYWHCGTLCRIERSQYPFQQVGPVVGADENGEIYHFDG